MNKSQDNLFSFIKLKVIRSFILKKIKPFLYFNRFLVCLTILAQIFSLIYFILSASNVSTWIQRALMLFSILMALFIISKHEKSGFKIIWILLIMIFPLFGGFTYLIFHGQGATRKFRKTLTKLEEKTRQTFLLTSPAFEQAILKNPEYHNNISYLEKFAGFPVFKNSTAKYLSPGEEFFPCLLEELEKAQKYIFMEYFIIDEGEMWNQILEVLERKAKEGVEVRVMYDDVGSFVLLPTNYPKILEKKGIKCVTFNQFKPFFIVSHNNRDHRKITVIDGKVGFTGGINLADEYINKKERHGYWKDASVMIQGEAVWSLTVIFLQLWNFSLKSTEDFAQFYPWKESKCDVKSDCFIQPYCDSPTDLENVGEHVYLNIITQAKKYLYIQTPYFIIDEQMLSAICLASKSGVDVRLVTPFKWDKFLVHTLTRSYYNDLINAGVKVYEYTPGFIHSKVVISDDKVATVGSANFDYRSLYHHFECGTCIYDSKSIEPIYKDFMDIVEKSKLIEKTDLKYNVIKSLFQQILRVFAPLM